MRVALLLAMALVMSTAAPNAEPKASLKPVTFAALAGWEAEDHAAALEAVHRSCREILDHGRAFVRRPHYAGEREDWLEACTKSFAKGNARQYFESNFRAFHVVDQERPSGLFTGYFEPEAEGSRSPSATFQVPIYRKPADLVAFDTEAEQATGLKYGRKAKGKPAAYFTRKEIEQGTLQGQGLEIVWLKHWEDAFFIHIQGSGRVKLDRGEVMRLSYAAKTGLPYTAIGGVLVKRGILDHKTNSMQSIRAWMSANPGESRELMWSNESFVFFREVQVMDDTLGALGAQQVHLSPRRSLAVDRSLWAFGTPVFLETTLPPEAGGAAFNHLMVAQDTGTAIKGAARGDVYWGWGEEAAHIAGHMKSQGSMTVLLPLAVARRLGLLP